MPPLKLGIHQLAASEAVVVRTLMWLYGGRDGCNWVFADAPPYDAVLMDTPPDASPTIAHTRHLVHLTRAAYTGKGPSSLARPLGADKLRQCLHQVEAVLSAPPAARASQSAEAGADRSPAVEPSAAPASSAAASAACAASELAPRDQPTLRAPLPPVLAQLGFPSAGACVDAQPADAPRHRLKRWPRAAVLRDDPKRIRMATLLSRRALNVRELTVLTGYAAPECQVFMQVLRSSDLLADDAPVQAPEPAAALHASPTAPATAGTTAATPPQGLTRGLIASFRRRLGL